MKKRGAHNLSGKRVLPLGFVHTPFFARIPRHLAQVPCFSSCFHLFSFVSFKCDDVIISLGYFKDCHCILLGYAMLMLLNEKETSSFTLDLQSLPSLENLYKASGSEFGESPIKVSSISSTFLFPRALLTFAI